MDARRALPFLLLVICVTNVTSATQNGWSGSNNIRRIRRINEYLVPPPPPRFHPSGRLPRLANPEQGYLTRLMNWLYPSSSSSQPPPQPPLPPEPGTPIYPPPTFVQPAPLPYGPPATVYQDPTPVDYEKPPLPPFSINDQSGYPSSAKAKTCNSCNRVPWMPIQHGEPTHSGDALYAPPPPPLSPQSSLNDGYLPPTNNHEVPYDAHHAASQEVRAPDFSFAPPLPAGEQDGTFISPLPNPHLYPGAIPPLFKAETFNPVQITPSENLGYLNTPPPAVFGNGAPTENGSFLAGPVFNDEHNGQSVYSGPSGHSDPGVVHQEPGYTNSGGSNGEFNHFHQDHGAHGDLSSSGTQVSHDHVNPIPDKQGVGDTPNGFIDSINYQPSFGSSDVRDRQPSGVSNNGESYESTGSSGLPGDFLDNTNQNLPSSYGISGLDQATNNYEGRYTDLSSSANVAEGSHVPLHASDGSPAKIADSINFEESPLLDFTRKDESRTNSSSIPSTSNAFASFESAVPSVTPGNPIFGTRQNIAQTESHLPRNYFETTDAVVSSKKSKINNSATQNTNENLHNPTNLREQDVSYIPPSDKAEFLWQSIFPRITTGADREPFRSTLKPNDDVAEETLNHNVNVNMAKTSVRQQGAKRNKKIQVIIPYTSEHTPFPFHPPHERKISNTSETYHNDYVGEESRSRIKVVSPPNSSHIFSTWPTSLEKTTKKPAGTKPNNSIDVHRLQKNIDNWTIKEYSKSTTASTISPSSVNPYLYPSKKIPHEYLTTTETVNHRHDSHDDNAKTFTLSGFSFDDPEYNGSASNRVVIKVEKSTESSTDTPTTSTNEDVWQSFSVGISPVNKELVYVVTPQPTITTPRLYPTEQRKEKAMKEADRNRKESRRALETDVKKTEKSDTFESIERAYQVLPQAVNNLAVASTGPENVPLWGIMEHEEFASSNDGEHNNEDTESLENPVLYSGHSKVSRGTR